MTDLEILNSIAKDYEARGTPAADARAGVVRNAAAELDPTPISEEWLEANGWKLASNKRDWLKYEAVLWRRSIVCWDTTFAIFTIKTLGEFRTLLRVWRVG